MPLDEFNLYLMPKGDGGALEPESYLYIVASHPLETQQPYAERLLACILNADIFALMFLPPSQTEMIVSLVCELVRALCRRSAQEPAQLATDREFLAVSNRLRIILTPHLCADSVYILNAHNPHQAQSYVYRTQDRHARKTAEHDEAVRYAEQIRSTLPERGGSLIQFCKGLADHETLSQDIRDLLAHRLELNQPDLLDIILAKPQQHASAQSNGRRKPPASSAVRSPGSRKTEKG